MEKEGITNIGLDPNSKKIVVEYGENNSKTIEDDNLTSEQKEIKKLFQQIGKNSLSQQEVRAEVKGKDEGDNNNWLKPAIGIGIVALFYKNVRKALSSEVVASNVIDEQVSIGT
ncbi:18362_t:CDS:2, partial [Funneliformis geosporum]